MSLLKNLSSDIKSSNQKHGDDSIGEGTKVRFNPTLQNYLKKSVGNDTFNFSKYDKKQITHTTNSQYPNSGGYLLQNWVIECNDKNNNCKIQSFIKSTKITSPKGLSGAINLALIGNSFMYFETSSSNHGIGVFVSFERNDKIQILI